MRRRSLSAPTPRGGKVFPHSKFNQARPKRTGAYIDPAKFVNSAVAMAEEAPFVPTHRFADFNLGERLFANVSASGYDVPTPIQDQAIPLVGTGRDVIGLANTGTGKTAAFLLPIIKKFADGRPHQALIVVPTRELANQIDDEFRRFAQGMNLYSAVCVGGVPIHGQINALNRRPQFVIGTPGRLKDLINQNKLHLNQCDVLVLDEADRMFDMGFIGDIRFIIRQLPAQRQSLCFSATMPPEIERLVKEVLTDPETISVRKGETAEHIEQDVIKAVSKDHKVELLTQMLRQPEFDKVLVFAQTKWGVQKLADNLVKQGLRAQAIHSNKSQSQRQRALKDFKEDRVNILVATDIAARGLDIPKVSHVINFDQPNNYADYVHRIGRTGRAGRAGQALTFVQG